MAVEFHNTGVMCMVTEADFCNVDLGNYFVKSDTQEQVLILIDRDNNKFYLNISLDRGAEKEAEL